MSSPPGPESLLILGGGGAVGTLFADALRKRYRVRRSDVRGADGVDLVADAADPEVVEAVGDSDVVLLALPEGPAERVIESYAAGLSNDQLLVDTLSVKSGYLDRVRSLGIRSEVLSLNPMFAPDLGFSGRSVATITVRGGERADRLRTSLTDEGAVLVDVSADEHDRLTAALQTAGHAAVIAFGRTLAALGYDAERMRSLWTPPHRLLLALLARMGSIDPEVYRDIQVGNSAAADARAALRDGLDDIEAALDDPTAFARLLESALEPLGEARGEMSELALRLFRQT